jgi:hypothetical protein
MVLAVTSVSDPDLAFPFDADPHQTLFSLMRIRGLFHIDANMRICTTGLQAAL